MCTDAAERAAPSRQCPADESAEPDGYRSPVKRLVGRWSARIARDKGELATRGIDGFGVCAYGARRLARYLASRSSSQCKAQGVVALAALYRRDGSACPIAGPPLARPLLGVYHAAAGLLRGRCP